MDERPLGDRLADAETARELAEAAWLRAEATASRATLLAEATSKLAISLDVTGSLRRLAQLIVPDLADWVIIDLAGEDGRPVQVAMLHRDGMDEVLRRFAQLQPRAMTNEAPIMQVLAGHPPILRAQALIPNATAYVSDNELLELCDVLGISSAMYIPLIARERVLGCMTLVAGRSGRSFTPEDLEFAADLGRRAALVVDNASLYEREHRVAELLQQKLLPSLPDIPGLDLAASYLPSDQGAEVGGDFYDVLALPDGSTGLAIGDVVGHDLDAAAAMGQLRVLLRACAWESTAEGDGRAGAVLSRLDRLGQGLGLTTMASLFYGRATPPPLEGAAWTLQYCSAGHPAPLLATPDGNIVELDQARGVLLGVEQDLHQPEGSISVPAGSLLVGFTDGLVERPGEDWECGIERVRQVVAHSGLETPPVHLARRLGELAGSQRHDDVAVLVVQFH